MVEVRVGEEVDKFVLRAAACAVEGEAVATVKTLVVVAVAVAAVAAAVPPAAAVAGGGG